MPPKRPFSSTTDNEAAAASGSASPAPPKAKAPKLDDALEAEFEADVEAAVQEAEEKARLDIDVNATASSSAERSRSAKSDAKSSAAALPFVEDDDALALERRSMDAKWFQRLESEMQTPNFTQLKSFIASEVAARKTIYPPTDQVYRWSTLTPPDRVKVVILGQDPYHSPKLANGLAFSVDRSCTIPPSLRNIYKELDAAYPEFKTPKHGCLDGWASQGVLLLNASLTVQSGAAGSHSGKGWEQFTRAVLRAVADDAASGVGIKASAPGGVAKQAEKAAVKNSAIASMFRKVEAKKKGEDVKPAKKDEPEQAASSTAGKSDEGRKGGVVFFAWGSFAAKALKDAGITDSSPNVLILRSVHPSPLSAHRGFFRAATPDKQKSHFAMCNEWLEKPEHYGSGGGINWADL